MQKEVESEQLRYEKQATAQGKQKGDHSQRHPRTRDEHPCSVLILSLFLIVFYSKGRGRKTNIFHLLAHSLNACDRWGWARPKPRAQNWVWISPMKGRDPDNWSQYCSLPTPAPRVCISRKLEAGAEPGLQPGTAGIPRCTRTTLPNTCLLFSNFKIRRC